MRLEFPFVHPFRDESGDTIQPISKIKFLVLYCMTHRQHTFAAVQVIEDSMTMGTVLTKKIILQEASKTVQSPITMQELTKAMQKGRDENRQGGWNTARILHRVKGHHYGRHVDTI